MAFLARYGHQQIITLLGRQPSALEMQLFSAALLEFVEAEKRADPMRPADG